MTGVENCVRTSSLRSGSTLQTTNQAKDFTRVIAVASIQRYYDAVPVIKAAKRQLGWER